MLDILTVEKSKKELTQKSLEVSEEEISDLQSLIDNMLSMVNDIGCIGITAPQVGVFKRIFVLYNGNVYINPIVILSSKKIMSIGEGCLSIPGKFYKVRRARTVILTYLDRTGQKNKEKFNKKFDSIAIQHEIDHLNGVLLCDKGIKI
jgi:peptide deformylase